MTSDTPKNQLPYIDQVTILVIPDQSTCLAALRSGKIDYLDQVSVVDSKNLAKTNPELLQIGFLGHHLYSRPAE